MFFSAHVEPDTFQETIYRNYQMASMRVHFKNGYNYSQGYLAWYPRGEWLSAANQCIYNLQYISSKKQMEVRK